MTSIAAVVLLLAAVTLRGAAVSKEDIPEQYNNGLQEPLDVDCPCGYALHKVYSVFDTDDRRWRWECTQISEVVKDKCKWTDPINSLGEYIVFRCPKNQYMAGIRSNFGNGDRIWRVKCCGTVGICPVHCSLTPCYLNEFEEDFHYSAKEGGVFVGLVSQFNFFDSGNDRQWWIAECEAAQCQLFPGIDLPQQYEKDVDREEERIARV